MVNKVSLWRSTPPAIFPVALGFMGLALAWRNVAAVLPIPAEIGDMMLGISTAFFLFFALSYGAKALRRPKAVFEDLKMPPARAGVAALPMSIMLLAAAFLPLGISAGAIWWTGIVIYVGIAGLVAYSILKGPAEARQFSPFQYISFVGLIVAPIAGVSLGFVTESFWLAMVSLPPYIIISAGYGAKLVRMRPPAMLRPSLMIVLAPTSLFAMAFFQLDIVWAFTLFYWMAVALALVLLAAGLWLTKGGWTPIWGSFTFPIAAFLNMQIMTLSAGQNVVAMTFVIAGLAIGTPLILYIVWKTSQAWIKGGLAKNTGASVA